MKGCEAMSEIMPPEPAGFQLIALIAPAIAILLVIFVGLPMIHNLANTPSLFGSIINSGPGMSRDAITHDSYFANISGNVSSLKLVKTSYPGCEHVPYGYFYTFADGNNQTHTAHVWVGQNNAWVGNVEYDSPYYHSE
jgi:hypothetical protein